MPRVYQFFIKCFLRDFILGSPHLHHASEAGGRELLDFSPHFLDLCSNLWRPYYSLKMPKVPIFRCPKMGLRAPESKNGDHFFTRTPPQNGGLGICFMCLPRKVIFGHFIDFEYFGSDFSCFYIVKTPKIEMASRLSFMGL